MRVTLLPEAMQELQALPEAEQAAMGTVIERLELWGEQLRFPYTSQVRGARKLRELRPRGGRSAWRAFYRRVGQEWLIAAIGPEALADPQRFRRAVRLAEQRLELAG